MLTLPKIIERDAQPFVAMRRRVNLPFSATVDATLPKLWAWIEAHHVDPAGPPFFKYNTISMAGELEIDFGVPTETMLAADEEVVTGLLPAGRYASLTYHGPYDNLRDVNAVLIGWVKENRLELDQETSGAEDRFACRLEMYTTDPSEVPESANWETVLAFKLRQA